MSRFKQIVGNVGRDAGVIAAISAGATTRAEDILTTASGAVSKTLDPGAAFTFIDVVVTTDGVITTSEKLKIMSVTGAVEIIEHQEDLSLLDVGDFPYVFRFDKRFASGRTLKFTFDNTQDNAISLIVQTQIT